VTAALEWISVWVKDSHWSTSDCSSSVAPSNWADLDDFFATETHTHQLTDRRRKQMTVAVEGEIRDSRSRHQVIKTGITECK
jgi:hypothetical protein